MRTLILKVSTASLIVAPALAAPVSPCTLLTKAEVQAAVGKAAVGEPKQNAANPKVCDFKVGDMGTIGVMATLMGPADSADKTIAELRKRNIKVTEKAGLGDKAFFANMGYGMVQLNAMKGKNWIILTLMVIGASEAQQNGIAEQLMGKALAKL